MSGIVKRYNSIVLSLQMRLRPAVLLFFRLWVAWVFLKSGLSKWNNWDTTLYLFSEEYQVPFLSAEFAAYLGTAAELILPLFLIIGLGTRVFGGALFLFNIMAVVSYPVLTANGFSLFAVGAMDHQIWGLMLLVIVLFGPGKFALDRCFNIK